MKIKFQARLAFPNLFSPKAGQDGGAPKYNASLLVAKEDAKTIKAINEAIDKVAGEKWGAKAAQVLKQLRAADKVCLHDGEAKSQYAGFEGAMYVSASNPVKPTVLDADKSPLTQADGKPYSGCYVNAVIEVWAQDNQYGKRVNATLMGVQFAKDGEAFTGGGAADEDDFDDISAGVEAEDIV